MPEETTAEQIDAAVDSLIENETFIDSYVESDDQTDVTTPDGTSIPSLQKRDRLLSEAGHSGRTDNPHAVTKAQVGLASAEDTSDADKPISTAQQAALDLKADSASTMTSLAGKADVSMTNVSAGSVTLGLLGADVTALLGTGFNPALGQGNWDPAANSPVIPAGGTAGRWYRVTPAGTASSTNADGTYLEDDIIVDNGTSWVLFRFPAVNLADDSVNRAKLDGALKTDVGTDGFNAPTVNNFIVAGPSGAAATNLTPTGFEATGTHTNVTCRSNNSFYVESGDDIQIDFNVSTGAHLERIRLIYWNGSSWVEANATGDRITTATDGVNSGTILCNYTGNIQVEVKLSDGTSIAGTIFSAFAASIPAIPGTYKDRLDAVEADVAQLEIDVPAISARVTVLEGTGVFGLDKFTAQTIADLGITLETPAVPDTEVTLTTNMVVLGPSGSAATSLSATGFTGANGYTNLSIRNGDIFAVNSGDTIEIDFQISDPNVFERIRLMYWNGSSWAEANDTADRITVASGDLDTGQIESNYTGNVYIEVKLSGGDITGVVFSNLGISYAGTGTPGVPGITVDQRLDAVEAFESRIEDLEQSDVQIVDDFGNRSANIELKGCEAPDGDIAVLTMPALDFGTRDCSFGGPVQRQQSRQLVCSNVSANVGLQLWWEEDGTFTLIFGNGSDLTTYSWTTTNKAWVRVGEWVQLYVSLDRDDAALIFLNGVALDDSAGAIERVDISTASAQTISSGNTWTFGGDGTISTPCALADLWVFEYGALTEELALERKLNPTSLKRSWLHSVDMLPVESLLIEYGGAGLSRLNGAYVELLGQSDWLRLDPTLESNTHYLNFTSLAASAQAGDDIRVECDVFVPIGNVDATGFRLDVTEGGANQQILFGAASVAKGQTVHLRANLTAANTQDRFRLWVTKGSTTSYFPTTQEFVYVRNLRLFINGAQRIIDMRVTGTTKTDRIGANNGTRNASATDID